MYLLWIIIGLMVISMIVRLATSHSRRQSWMQARQSRMGGGGAVDSSTLGILNQRYAKGELTKEEYDQKKKDLGV